MRTVYVVSIAALSAVSAYAQNGGGSQQGPDMMSMVLMMGAILLIMYFLMIRPEQKKQKARQAMIEKLTKGNKVVTTGGIHGTVGNVKEGSVMLKVADGVSIEFAKASIASVVGANSAKDEKKN